MTVIKLTGSALGLIALFLTASWLIQGNDFFLYKTFAPKYEAVRRETFEETKSYNEGMAQEIRQAKLDYARAKSPNEKQAIASYVLHESAGLDRSRLPDDLSSFLESLSEAGQ